MEELFRLKEWELREKFLNMDRLELIRFAKENEIPIEYNMRHKQLVEHLSYEIYMLGVFKRIAGEI